MTTELKNTIEKLATEFTPLLNEIHSKSSTTKNYYGEYMNILSRFSNKGIGTIKLIALGLIKAGANVNGVNDAVKIIAGH